MACRSGDNPPADFASSPDLHGRDLAGADLAGADLAGADLAGADLADLNGVPPDLSTTPVDLNGVPPDLNTTPVDLNGVPPDLSTTPVDMNTTPADLNTAPADMTSPPDMYTPPFSPVVQYATTNGPTPIANGDVDGDGDLDIVVVTTMSTPAPGNAFIDTLLGAGDGSFTTGTQITTALPVNSSTLSLGDINGDGVLDAVVTAYTANVYLLIGAGNGSFGAPSAITVTNASTLSVARIADMDGDDHLDIVVGDFGNFAQNGFVRVLLNDGSGAFPASGQTAYSVSTNTDASVYRLPVALRVGQLDADTNGTPDVAVLNGTVSQTDLHGTFSVLQNGSTAGFVSLSLGTEVATGQGPSDIRIAPIVGSTHAAILVGNLQDNDASVFLSSATMAGTVGYATPTNFTGVANTGSFSNPVALNYADVDSDGFPDLLILGSAGGGYLTIVYGGAGGVFGMSADHAGIEAFQAGVGPSGITVGKLDVNASVDIAVSAQQSDQVNVFLNQR